MTRDERAVAAALREALRAWDRWSAESLEAHGSRALVRQEARRLVCTVALLAGHRAPRRILEIGTGYLTLASMLRRAFPDATLVGVEHPGRPYLWTAGYAKRLAEDAVVIVAADVERGLPFADGAFDAVAFAEVIEHLPPNVIPTALGEIRRVLADGGALALTTPNLASWTNRELVLRGHSPMQSPARVIDGTYAHLRLYTAAELQTLLGGAGFTVERATHFDQRPVGSSPTRRLLAALTAPARRLCPALRATCAIRAVACGGKR